ncbi:hypothetical protein ACWCYL_33140 [Streptomyces sp. 900105755]
MPKTHPVGDGDGRPAADYEPFDGSGLSVTGADGGDVVVELRDESAVAFPVVPASGVELAVADEAEVGVDEGVPPLVGDGVSSGAVVFSGGGAEVAAPEAGALGVRLGVGTGPVAGLVAGQGCGALGSSRTSEWGHRNRHRPNPAAVRTAPAARWAARTRRRACTPARSRSRCRGSKAAGSRSSCIHCVNCRSK